MKLGTRAVHVATHCSGIVDEPDCENNILASNAHGMRNVNFEVFANCDWPWILWLAGEMHLARHCAVLIDVEFGINRIGASR